MSSVKGWRFFLSCFKEKILPWHLTSWKPDGLKEVNIILETIFSFLCNLAGLLFLLVIVVFLFYVLYFLLICAGAFIRESIRDLEVQFDEARDEEARKKELDKIRKQRFLDCIEELRD